MERVVNMAYDGFQSERKGGRMNIDEAVLIDLLDAALAADYTRLRRVGGELARLLSESGEAEMAKRIRSLIRKRGMPLQASGITEALPVDAASRLPLIEEQDWPVTPLFVNEAVRDVLLRFLEDAQNVELLTQRGLSPRLCLMLSGSPGTGKSLLAGHVAAQLRRPLYVARLDSLITSRLGETAKNIRGIFEFVPERGAALFLDELDAIAKLRDDKHELGELKRVVNTVIQGLDSVPDNSVVIGATNHPHLLDSAIWRRFPYKIEIHAPDQDVRAAMWLHFLYEDAPDKEHTAGLLAALSEDLSGADIENLALTARRQSVLEKRALDLTAVAWAAMQSRGKPLRLASRSGLTAGQKKELAQQLASLKKVKKFEIAELLGVSRQMVTRYLKDDAHG
jgi:hypothetical protein